MAVTHINRRGDTYYLHEGKTKTGKPKFFFSKKEAGELAKAVPDKFEIYENPNAQVFLRRITPKLIAEEELAVVEKGIRDHAKLKHFFVEVQKDALVVYLPNEKVAGLEEALSPFVGFDLRSLPNVERFLTYSPMMRFVLVDEEQRLFIAERWCFLGSIDTWIHLSGAARLTSLLKKYGPHLGKESFFELM